MLTLILTVGVIVALTAGILWLFKKVPKRFIVTGFVAFFMCTALSTVLFPVPTSPMIIHFDVPGGDKITSPTTDILVQAVDGSFIGRAKGINDGKAIVFISSTNVALGVSVTTVGTENYTDLAAYPVIFDNDNTPEGITVEMNPGPDRVLQELDAVSIYLVNFRIYDVVLYSFQLMMEGTLIGKFVAALLLTFFWLFSGVLGLVIDIIYNSVLKTRQRVVSTREGMEHAHQKIKEKIN